MVDTRHLKQARQHCVANQDYEAACACRDAEDELDALRKRCEQLERLVCQTRYRIEGDEPCVDLMDMDDLECLGSFGTRKAAIDAAIKHLEQEASDAVD